MKKHMFLLMAACLCSIAAAAPLDCAEPPVFIRGVRPLAMGGAFVGLADDQNAIFYNPAGITQRRSGQLTIFELPINIGDDIFSFYNFYDKNRDNLENFDSLPHADKVSLLDEINTSITKYQPRIRLGFPNTGFLSGPGFLSWGIGIFSQADLSFKMNKSLIIPNISFLGNVDGIGTVPLAHRFDSLPFIPGKMSVGTTLKYIARARIAEYNKSILEFENFDPLLQMGMGMGLDFGAMYQPFDTLNIGLQVTDFGGTPIVFQRVESSKTNEAREASTGVIYPQWNVGTAYIPSKIYYWPGRSINTLNRLTLAADLRDILNTDEKLLDDTFWKKLHFGAEFRWSLLALRGGFNSGYPTFGAGINLFLLQLEYAFWGDELGRFAGQIPEWNHQLSISMRFGQNKGRAWGKSAMPAPAKTAKTTEPQIAESVKPVTPEQNHSPAPAEAAPTEVTPAEAAPADSAPAEKPATESAPPK
ncbi:MAG: hypothetical protein A2314_01490 [Elusimicrobia bacterium RIFOXYB2_FULL_50_12]|nr:MAG: hypothetical protein A2314_01490 [Elusimicrobia bacterium RIFOXYB2_FULL_50_12]